MARRKQLGITWILSEAFRCLHWNPKLLLSSLILILIPLNHLRTLPTLINPQLVLNITYIATLLRLNKLTNPEAKRFTIRLYPIGLLISLVLDFAIVYFSIIAYNGRNFRLHELRSKCKRTWKGSTLTFLCARFISSAYYGLFFILGALLQKMTASSMRVALIMNILLLIFLLGALFLFYVVMVAKVSLVVSIVEEGCYGIHALRRAGSLVRGRKLHGFVVMVVMYVLDRVVLLVIRAVSVDRRRGDGWHLSLIARVAAGILVRSLVVNLSLLYNSLVYTVYYYECKRSHGKGREEEKQGLYRLIPLTSHIDALP